MRISQFTRTALATIVCGGALLTVATPTQANKDLDKLSKRR